MTRVGDLCKAGGFRVVLLNGTAGPEDYPLLIVGVQDQKTYWTPFYAGGTLRVLAKYMTYAGDESLGNTNATFDGSEAQGAFPMCVIMNTEVSSSSVGVISLPAHRRNLIREPAAEILKYVQESLDELKAKTAVTP